MLNDLIRKILWDLALKRTLNKNDLETLGITDENNPALIISTALRNGFQLNEILEILTWQNFELIVAGVYELNNFTTIRNFHFMSQNKRNEIDIIAIRDKYVHVIECKHWIRTRISSNISRIVNNHLSKTLLFKNIAEKILAPLTINKSMMILIPVIVIPPKSVPENVSGIPIVTLYQLQDFINKFEDYIDEIEHIPIKITKDESLVL
ncbi:MAG: NERD domain-containing protein [Thermoprotei archaeon]|jgi:Holliday junction resolvase-like predicted endonuclease